MRLGITLFYMHVKIIFALAFAYLVLTLYSQFRSSLGETMTRTINQKNDTESMLYLFSLSTALIIISCFGFYKVIIGERDIALIDFSICLLILFALIKVSQNKFTIRTKVVFIFLCGLGVLSIIYIKGNISSLYWIYPLVTGLFFLLGSQIALPINIFFIMLSMSIASMNISTQQLVNLFSSLGLVCISGYVFSVRAEIYQKQLAKLADIDPLTKLKNRHSLEDQLNNEIILHKKNIYTSSLLILDLDHFKKINDSHGHTVGDNTLISFSNMLKKTVRDSDSVYRYGGEEFIIIANNTKLDKAGKLAEHLRKTTEKTITAEGDPVTVSIGIAEVKEEDTPTSWLHRTDQALYEAKSFSRNTVFLAHDISDYREYIPINKKQEVCSKTTNRLQIS